MKQTSYNTYGPQL